LAKNNESEELVASDLITKAVCVFTGVIAVALILFACYQFFFLAM
jgi:hypothetical protein